MVINDEEKNAFTQSVMGDTEGGGGGGSAVRIDIDNETGELGATFNELVEYFNNGKIIFTSGSGMGENEGTTIYSWYLLTSIRSVQNGASRLYYAEFSRFSIFESDPRIDIFVFAATDPDEKMMPD